MTLAALLFLACALSGPAAAQEGAESHAAEIESLAGAALTLDSLGHPEDAAPFWDKALALAPRDASLWEERAWSLAAAGRLKPARSSFDQAVALSSAAPSWTALLGSGAEDFLAGRGAAAEARLHEAMMAAPLQAAVPLLSGKLSEAAGARDAALAYYRSAYQDDSRQPEAEAALARLLERQGQPRAALGYALSLSRQDPSDARAAARARALRRTLGSEGAPPGPRRLDELLVRDPKPERRAPGIEVALVSDAAGQAAAVGAFIWTCNSDFSLRGSSGTVIAGGHAFDPWGVEYDTRTATLRIGPLGAPPAYRAPPPLRLAADRSGADFLIQDLRAPAAPGRDIGDREVRGELELEPAADGVRLILQSNLEDYVRDRLAAAVPSGTDSEEGLRALAVVVRTRALLAKERTSGPLCDSAFCGRFSGVQDEYPLADRAVARSTGYVLREGRSLFEAAFQRSCGGVSEPGRRGPVWDMPPIPLESPWVLERFLLGPVPNGLLDTAAGAANADARWSRVLDARDVEARLRRMGLKGRLEGLVAGRRDASGRLLSMAAAGRRNTLLLDASGMEQALSPGTLRSTFFTLKTLRKHGRPALFLLFGAGTGDGIGLCEAGADGLAAQGQDFRRILRHYFRQAKLVRLYR